MFGKFEPILNAATISSVVSAILTCLVAFNVPITEEQRNALIALVVTVGSIFWVGSAVARQQVTPVAKVEKNILPLVQPVLQDAAEDALLTGDVPVIPVQHYPGS